MPLNRFRKYRKSYGRRRKMGSRRSYGNRSKFRTNPSIRSDRANNIITVPGKSVMPQRLRTQFTYNVQKQLTAIGTGAFIIFRGNSLFDPDQTSVGQRANSLTEMSAFYSKYAVIGSSITIEIANADVPIRILVYPTADSGATGLTYGTALTVPKVKHTTVGSLNGIGLGRLHNYSTTFDMLNQDPATDDGVQSLVTTNPGDQWYWIILARAMDDASVWACTLNINVVYYTVLSQRKLVSYV